MRPDIVPGAVFPDYELPDHRGEAPQAVGAAGATRWCWCCRAAGSARRTGASTRACCSCTARWRSAIAGWSPSPPTSCWRRTNSAPASARTGRSSPIRDAPSRRTSTSRSTPTRTHNPMIPHTLVLEPGLRRLHDLQRLLVLRPPDRRGAAPGSARRAAACRPDWDISSAEQRTAWANGDKARFYPYGKTRAQVLSERE